MPKPAILLSTGFKHNPRIKSLSAIDRDRLLSLYFLRNDFEGDFRDLPEQEIADYLGCALPDLLVTKNTLSFRNLIDDFYEPVDCGKLNHSYNKNAAKQKGYRERQKAKMLAKESEKNIKIPNKKQGNLSGPATALKPISLLLGNALR